MLIPGSAIAQNLRGIEFPVVIWSQDWSVVESEANHDEFMVLAGADAIVGIGTRTVIRRVRMNMPMEQALERAAEKTRLLREELRTLRETRERAPGDALFRMIAARKFTKREYLFVDGEWTGHWTWAHKRILLG